MKQLMQDARQCLECAASLELGCRPVFSIGKRSKIAIIGQAPGKKVHDSGIAWDDKSGYNLRKWLNVEKESFYNVNHFAILPMGFCYPGKGKSGDLPPRKECAPLWHERMLAEMPEIELFLLIGQYAQGYYLNDEVRKPTLTETVQNYENYLPKFFPLPHPSPRNNIWMKKNGWFQESVVPALQKEVERILP